MTGKALEWVGPLGRRELTARFGSAAMDQVHLHWDCMRCSTVVANSDVVAIGSVPYRSVSALIAHSRQGRGIGEVSERACPGCGHAAVLRAADYHAYQSETDRDFVVRWTRDFAEPTFWFWDGASYRATRSPFADGYDEDNFADETTLRRAATIYEVDGVEAARDAIAEAAVVCDGWWEMVSFVEPLAHAGEIALALEIVDAYLATHAGDDDDDDDALLKNRMEEARRWRDALAEDA